MAKKKSVFVVPHTHWDRAWYAPFEEFRLRLVRLVDRVCDTLESDASFTKFCLDGQTVVLEDYLAIRPQYAERLRRLVKAGRLYVGPWYVLPDEFLVSGESLVRNLMLGHRLSGEFGHTMSVGYVPDPFGHVAQLPQILRGFGHDTFLFARGIDMATDGDLKVEFEWAGLDGSTVLALHQRFFYNNAAFLGYRIVWGDSDGMILDPKLAMEQIGQAVAALEPHTHTDIFLLNNGVDHSEHQKETPRLLAKAAKRFPQYEFKIGSFEDYAQAVRRSVNGATLQRKHGELTYRYGDMLPGVYSSRMYLKTANQHSEDLLEKYAEPLSAIAWLAEGGAYPQDQLWYAWRELLKNHPHDDICGCSVDQVHRDMEARTRVVELVGQAIATDGIRRMGRCIDTSWQAGVPVVVFNPLSVAHDAVQRVSIDLAKGVEPWESIALCDESGNALPYELVEREDVAWAEPLKSFNVRRFHVDVRLEVPPLGYRTLYVREGKPAKVTAGAKVSARGFENAWYKVTIGDDGALRLRDKASGLEFSDLLVYEDMEDCGDEYNWSYLAENSQRLTTSGSKAKVELTYGGRLSATWRITHSMKVPAGLTENRQARSKQTVALEIVAEVTCRVDSPRIDVVTRVDNRACDHRLRVLFPTSIESDYVDVDGHFGVVRRSALPPPMRENLPPYPTQHQGRFADLSDTRGGFAILNDGLPEFEVVCEGRTRTLAQTLFRATGWLSRDDYPVRPFMVGPRVPAPEAQCLRPMKFRHAFMAHRGDWRAVLPEALRHNVATMCSRCDIPDGMDLRQTGVFHVDRFCQGQPVRPVPRSGPLPPSGSVVDLGNERLVVSAFKRCETRKTLIVRFYNPGGTREKALLSAFRPITRAWLTDLKESRQTALKPTRGRLKLDCGPYKIMTVEIVL